MISRCENSSDSQYYRYGASGISVCEDWHSFDLFCLWAINNGFRFGLTIDRFPNQSGNYTPENCRWATIVEQNRNKKNNVIISAWGESKPLAAWESDDRCLCSNFAILNRLRKGVSAELAISSPPLVGRQGHRQMKELIRLTIQSQVSSSPSSPPNSPSPSSSGPPSLASKAEHESPGATVSATSGCSHMPSEESM